MYNQNNFNACDYDISLAKTVVVQRFGKDSKLTLHQVMRYMEDYRDTHPTRDIFFDGDRFALCYVKK